MMMSQLSMDLSIEEPLTSYQQDSPANRTPLLDFVKRLVMSVTYGEKSSEYYGRRNQHGSWEKTFQDSLLLSLDNSLDVSSMTWSRWGLAWDGVVTELKILEQLTSVTGSSLLPTPRANNAMATNLTSENLRNHPHPNLEVVIGRQLLPTPTASQDYKAVRPLSPSEANGTHGKTLVGDVGNQLKVEIGESGESERLYLNPEFVETMMGFPTGWTSIEPND